MTISRFCEGNGSELGKFFACIHAYEKEHIWKFFSLCIFLCPSGQATQKIRKRKYTQSNIKVSNVHLSDPSRLIIIFWKLLKEVTSEVRASYTGVPKSSTNLPILGIKSSLFCLAGRKPCFAKSKPDFLRKLLDVSGTQHFKGCCNTKACADLICKELYLSLGQPSDGSGMWV